jgi:hypothetical protein
MGVALGSVGRLVPVRFRNRIDTPSRDQYVKRFTLRYRKRDARVVTLRLLWSVEGRPPFEADNFDVSGQAVDTVQEYELPRDPMRLWDIGIGAPPAFDITPGDLGVLTPTGTSVTGPGSGQVKIINVKNANTTTARTLRVVTEAPESFTYTIQPGGRLALALLETPTIMGVTLFDDADTGDLSAVVVGLLLAQVVLFTYGVSVQELDSAGNVLSVQEATGRLVFANVGVPPPPAGDLLIAAAGGD